MNLTREVSVEQWSKKAPGLESVGPEIRLLN